jgi:ABC-type tungstate transport system substrate-binding protein
MKTLLFIRFTFGGMLMHIAVLALPLLMALTCSNATGCNEKEHKVAPKTSRNMAAPQSIHPLDVFYKYY